MMDEATQRQVRAADPTLSTWLSANAGSGKTRVLTVRVARLLLQGVDPQNILCLTYTKAAASEMQNRLFQRLGGWAMLPDTDLVRDLRGLGIDGALSADRLRTARTLFARAIETPGGLKIQTIHAFCAGLLRRFPLEAGVSPQFAEMEDRAAQLLRAEVLDVMSDGPVAGLVDGIVRYLSDEKLDPLVRAVLGNREIFGTAPDHAKLAGVFGVPPGLSIADLLDRLLGAEERSMIARLCTACRQGSTNDQKAAEKLAHITPDRPPRAADLALLEDVFLTGNGSKEPFTAKIGSFPTKATRAANPEVVAAAEELMDAVEQARPDRLALMALERTTALYQFAAWFIPAYEARKLAQGLLDFDDLIAKAGALLTDPQVAEWVLFKLDGGIDHILVDEAQDTSPAQWAVIQRLAREFAVGQGARPDRERTIFVVGDKKQSIYSFQGADPDGFDRMRDHFGTQLAQIGKPLQSEQLAYSFRSSPAILRLVDQTFMGPSGDGVGTDLSHYAHKADLPGRVDLWPVIAEEKAEADIVWYEPVDQVSPQHHNVQLARRIASEIRRMKLHETVPVGPDRNGVHYRRPITEGDILILVQRRSDLFAELIRACKEAGLQIAGADRLKIGEELAVKDIVALLRFLALPEDDLSLAAALRSPLFGWTEQQLFTVAHHRPDGRTLWEAVRQADITEGREILDDLRRQADFLRPYDLIERLLIRHDGRKRLLARLGEEAEDGIDALLSQALSYEQSSIPSLTGFLSWLETEDVEIKRQLDSAGDRIRVMTVHGSKGLEAPIVILPETQKRPVQVNDELLVSGDHVLWKTNKAEQPPIMEALRIDRERAQEQERRRLLYVAMTRAEKWLIVCAAGDIGTGDDSWYGMIERAMGQAGAEDHDFGFGIGQRFALGDWSDLPMNEPVVAADPVIEPPNFALIESLPPSGKTLSPSDLGGPKALPGEGADSDTEQAKLRGTLVHLLLEHLPSWSADRRLSLGQSLLNAHPDVAAAGETETLIADAMRLIDDPALTHIFDAETLSEVEVTAALDDVGGQRIHGTIDRLIVTPDKVTAIDFKSNRKVPMSASDVPEGILRQMGAYQAALTQIYSGRTVQTSILWTATGQVMPLDSAQIIAALRRAVVP